MANYGLQTTPGRVAFTGFSPTLGSGDAVTYSTSGYAYANGISSADQTIARIFRNGPQHRVAKQLLYTLIGAAAGSAATKTRARRTAQAFANDGGGGLVPIETVTLVSRNTTAADATAFKALLDRVPYPSTYVADASMNGGGGKGAW